MEYALLVLMLIPPVVLATDRNHGGGTVAPIDIGLVLGAAYAFVAKRCTFGQMTPLKVFVYVWFVVASYQTIRGTTFSMFSRFAIQVLPVVVLVAVSYRLIRAACGKGITEASTSSRIGA